MSEPDYDPNPNSPLVFRIGWLMLSAFILSQAAQIWLFWTVGAELQKQEAALTRESQNLQLTLGRERTVETRLTALLEEIFKLANNEPDLHKIIEKYGIARNLPPPSRPPPPDRLP